MQPHRNMLTLAIAVFAITLLPAGADDLVVLESNAPALPAGQLIDSESLNLPAGTSITVISANGQSTTIKGPHTGPLPTSRKPEDGARISAALSRLIADDATSTSSLGAVRGVEEAADVPMGTLSAEYVGAQCLVANTLPGLLRANAAKPESVSLKQVPGNEAEVLWARGQNTTDWPETIPIEDGGVYLLRRAGRTIPLKIELHVLENDTASQAFNVAWAASQGCTIQAKSGLADLSQ